MSDELLTTDAAAERLNVTPGRVRAMIAAGRLPAEKFGFVHMIKASDLKLLEGRKVGRPPKQATAAPPTTNSEIRRADKTAQKLNEAFRKAAEDEQKAGKKKGKKIT